MLIHAYPSTSFSLCVCVYICVYNFFIKIRCHCLMIPCLPLFTFSFQQNFISYDTQLYSYGLGPKEVFYMSFVQTSTYLPRTTPYIWLLFLTQPHAFFISSVLVVGTVFCRMSYLCILIVFFYFSIPCISYKMDITTKGW